MAAKRFTVKVGTNPVRLSYAKLVKPSNAPADFKYSAALLIPKSDKECLKKLKTAMASVYENNPSMLQDYDFESMIRIYDGDKASPTGKKYGPEYHGFWVLNASNNRLPLYLNKNKEEIDDVEEELYSGVWAKVGLTFFPYSSNGNTGIGCSLDLVKKYKDDEHFGGTVSAGDYFTDEEEEDPDDI